LPNIGKKKVTAAFDGNSINADGGVFLRADAVGLIDALARRFPDSRDQFAIPLASQIQEDRWPQPLAGASTDLESGELDVNSDCCSGRAKATQSAGFFAARLGAIDSNLRQSCKPSKMVVRKVRRIRHCRKNRCADLVRGNESTEGRNTNDLRGTPRCKLHRMAALHQSVTK
jgi:hypothetical protein